ncbi:hypothetical protein SCULI_v1c04990 [Spiroplasma culicicola AES-1]|uniref:Metallo-beta-lactamase domain-containing protein n=2 Tax=Spiroplasma culicicola TaxID=216935 RepID=W6A7L0_9MOLU|nr:hypothetical protein SCULI_v1c04990 [Spiroplasma culicicola AES-1]
MFIMRSFTNEELNSSVAHLLVNQDNTAILIDIFGLDNTIINFLEKRNIELTTIILTNGNINHGLGIDNIVKKYPEVNLIIDPEEYDRLITNINKNESQKTPWDIKHKIFINKSFQLVIKNFEFSFDKFEINNELKHMFYTKEQKLLFVGDIPLCDQADFTSSNSKEVAKTAIKYIFENYGTEVNIVSSHSENTFKLDEIILDGKKFKEII